jgi:hypothetical protein
LDILNTRNSVALFGGIRQVKIGVRLEWMLDSNDAIPMGQHDPETP